MNERKKIIKMYTEKKMMVNSTNVYIAKGEKDESKIDSSVECSSNEFSCLKLITEAAFTRGTCIYHQIMDGCFTV